MLARSSSNDWYCCPTEDNPVDSLKRGVVADVLLLNEKWWLVPVWLRMKNECWSKQIVKASVDVDNADVLRLQRENAIKKCAFTLELVDQLWNKFSAWSKLQRVSAWCLRFISNARGNKISTSFLLTTEFIKSHNIIIKIEQKTSFTKEIVDLKQARMLKNNTFISSNPFLDNYGLLRVGENPTCLRL